MRLPESKLLCWQLLHDPKGLVFTLGGKNSKGGGVGMDGSEEDLEPLSLPLSPKLGHRIRRRVTLATVIRLKQV